MRRDDQSRADRSPHNAHSESDRTPSATARPTRNRCASGAGCRR
jgi:hypothetical protein